MYEYRGVVKHIVDGDTIDFDVDVGFYIHLTMRIRLKGVDTPEVRGKERPEGLISSAFVKEQLPLGMNVLLRTHKIGKFGRYIAEVRYIPGEMTPPMARIMEEGVDLSEELLERGLAEPVHY